MDHEQFMRAALREAEKSVEKGNGPFGAIIVSPEGEIVARAHELVKTTGDPTAHAEVSAVRELCVRTGKKNFRGYYAYTTSEPCPMCVAAMLKAKIDHFVYGAQMEETASLPIRAEEIVKKYRQFTPELMGGVLEGECLRQRIAAGGSK